MVCVRSMRGRLAAVVVAAALVAGCTAREARSYDDAEDDFITNCAAGTGNEDDCRCAYGKIQDAMSFEEFKKLDERLQEHPEEITSTADDLVGFLADCQAAGGSTTTGSDTTTTTLG